MIKKRKPALSAAEERILQSTVMQRPELTKPLISLRKTGEIPHKHIIESAISPGQAKQAYSFMVQEAINIVASRSKIPGLNKGETFNLFIHSINLTNYNMLMNAGRIPPKEASIRILDMLEEATENPEDIHIIHNLASINLEVLKERIQKKTGKSYL